MPDTVLTIPAGQKSRIWFLTFKDSRSTTDAGLTGIAYNSAGLKASLIRDTDGDVSIISPFANNGLLGSFVANSLIEVDPINLPGEYQYCPPDALFIAGGTTECRFADLLFSGAANMLPCRVKVLIGGGGETISVSQENVQVRQG